jgi:DNA-binding CsgD family transcriptional regulator
MKCGAIDFFTKPVNGATLLNSVEKALQRDSGNRLEAIEHAKLVTRYQSLTPREREVLHLLASGLLNKQTAFELGITEYTVQFHRGHIMRKIEADSFASLVRRRTGSILATHSTANKILGFIGIDDVQTVWAQGMNIAPLAIHADSSPSDHRNRNCGRCHGRAAYTSHRHGIASGSRSGIGRSRWCCLPRHAASDCRSGKDSEQQQNQP